MDTIRVLVIDDNEDVLNDYCKALMSRGSSDKLEQLEESLFGLATAGASSRSEHRFEVMTASQGHIGVDMVRKAVEQGHPFDIVFVDMRMPPGWDGKRTIQEIWNIHPDQFVVLCTAFSDYSLADLHRAFGRTGNFLLLRKPFSSEEVVQIVLSVVGRESSEFRVRRHLSKELSAALASDGLHLAFQPIVTLPTRHVCGFEALCRWRREDGSFARPDDFIPVAEEFGLIETLGSFVIRESCRSIKLLHQATPPAKPFITINTSVAQLCPAFVSDLVRQVEASSLEHDCVGIEVTESQAAHEGFACIETLAALRKEDFKVLIDDFGTGFSSLHTLAHVPFDIIKIDRSFCQRLTIDPATETVVRTIVQLAESLGGTCIAEGVESAEEEAALVSLGCHFAQGYFYAKPLSLQGAIRSLKQFEINVDRKAA
jgi:EAL domain-containing protein (putative c-di-GMP-specific phosphodiesterase class I)/ActR/RegA family two-component response regulator